METFTDRMQAVCVLVNTVHLASGTRLSNAAILLYKLP